MGELSDRVQARIEPDLKMKTETILRKIGLSPTEAVRLFYKQVVLQQGLPFEVKIPNKETLAAMKEAESGKGTRYKTADEMFGAWNKD